MEPTFEKLLVLFADRKVEFVLVGGVAVTLYGYVRLTEKVDILIKSSPENIARLLATLAGNGEGFARELSPEDFGDEEGAIRIVEETEMSQIDIFTRMSGQHHEHVATDAESIELAGHTIRFAAKPALIRLKDSPCGKRTNSTSMCSGSSKKTLELSISLSDGRKLENLGKQGFFGHLRWFQWWSYRETRNNQSE